MLFRIFALLCWNFLKPWQSKLRLRLLAILQLGELTPAKKVLPGRYHPRHLRTARLHRPAGGPGAQAEGEPHSLPRRVRPQQPAPHPGHRREAGQGYKANVSETYRERPPNASVHDLGPAPQVGVQHRHRDLPGIRRRRESHRLFEDPMVI